MTSSFSDDQIDHLKSLHTASIDARNGYQEALEDAEGRGLTSLFRDMIALHGGHAGELGAALNAAVCIAASDDPDAVLPKAIEAFHAMTTGFLAKTT